MADSDELVIDLSNYKDKVGARVLPGTYRVQVEDVEIAESRNKNPMINIWLRIVGGGEFDGSVIVDRLTQSEGAMFRTVNFMQAIGLPTPKKRVKVNIRSWTGKVLDVEVDDGEPYLGRIKSEVRAYLRVASSGSSGADLSEDLDGLNEFAQSISTGAVPGEGHTPEPIDDDLDVDEISL
jgi:hypothetical protein